MKHTGKSVEMLSFDDRVEQIKKISVVREEGLANLHAAQEKQKVSHRKRYGNKEKFALGANVYYSNARLRTRKGRKLDFKNLGSAFITGQVGKATFSIINQNTGKILKNNFLTDRLMLIKKSPESGVIRVCCQFLPTRSF